MNSYTYFTKPIFYGAGETSAKNVNELNRQIEEIHSINSGIQQPCHCDHECDCEEQFQRELEFKKQLGESIKKALNI